MGVESYISSIANNPEHLSVDEEIISSLNLLKENIHIIEDLESIIQHTKNLLKEVPGTIDFIKSQLADLQERATLDYEEDPRGLINKNDVGSFFGYNPIFDAVKKRVNESIATIDNLIDEYVPAILKELTSATEHLTAIIQCIKDPTASANNITHLKQNIANNMNRLQFYTNATSKNIAQLNQQEKTRGQTVFENIYSNDHQRVMKALDEVKVSIEKKFLHIINTHIGIEGKSLEDCMHTYKKTMMLFE